MELKDFWAKTEPFQSVVTHGIVCGTISKIIWDQLLAEGSREQICKGLDQDADRIKEFLSYIVSLHDIGKISYSFQYQDKKTAEKLGDAGLSVITASSEHYRHEKTTSNVLITIWKDAGFDRHDFRTYAEILSAHHQGKNGSPEKISTTWLRYQTEFELKMRSIFLTDSLIFPKIASDNQGVFQALFLAIVILSDWIASGVLFKDCEAWGERLIEETRTKTQKFLAESGLLSDSSIEYGNKFSDVWPNIPLGGERQLQLETQNLFAEATERISLLLIEAPMGEGKTEAGIYAATQMAKQWGKQGFYVGLPTAATANQMVSRMREFMQLHENGSNVKLLHAMAWMVDGDEMECYGTEEERFIHNWLMPTRRGLLSAYSVGTVDQALMAAMFVKYGVLRLFGLSGKVLIIDEVHAYDLYMTTILDHLLKWCKALEIPVVLLSATLPPEKKQKLLKLYSEETVDGQYPALTAVTEESHLLIKPFSKVAKKQVYQITLENYLAQPERIAENAKTNVKQGGCCCVLVNTVGQAQEIYKQLRDFDGTLLLFHSQFPAEQRDAIEKKCIHLFGKNSSERPEKAILVATQVVEQSLDVDFDYMVISIAPMDLVIQRMGREFRHNSIARPSNINHPRVTVLIPPGDDFGIDGYVYPPCILRQTEQLLKRYREIRIPEDVEALVRSCYEASEMQDWLEYIIEDNVKAAQANRYMISSPDKKFSPLHIAADFDDLEGQSYLSAKTRLSDPTIRVALLENDLLSQLKQTCVDDTAHVKSKWLAQAVLGQSVSVREKKYQKFALQYHLSDIKCDNLLSGVRVLPIKNAAMAFDPSLGLIWKEEHSEEKI